MFKKVVNKICSYKLVIVGLAILCVLPLFIRDSYFLYVFVIGGIYALLASSYDFLGGYTGQISFGHAAFFGIGAYTSALLVLYAGISPYFGIFIGGIVAALFGLVIGFPCLRLKGSYLSITTLGFAEIMRLIITNEEEITRGPLGLSVSSLPGVPQGTLSYHIFNYYVILIILSVSILIMYTIIKSQVGLCFRAIREDETAAEAAGINIAKYKIIAFVVSSFFAGIAGGFFGHYVLLISPPILSVSTTFMVIAITMFGGLGTLFGPILAAFILTFLNEYLRALMLYRFLIFAIVLITVITFIPQGIMGFRGGINFKNKFLRKYLNLFSAKKEKKND